MSSRTRTVTQASAAAAAAAAAAAFALSLSTTFLLFVLLCFGQRFHHLLACSKKMSLYLSIFPPPPSLT
jgi:hypothetical protein